MAESSIAVLHALTDDEATNLRRRLDSFANQITGIGGTFDKRMGGFPFVRLFDYQYWANLYRANDMAARIAEAGPEDMVRKGWRCAIEEDHDASETVDMFVDDLEIRKHFLQALKWERVFGGSGIFIGANDGQTADKPLDEDNIESIDFLLPLDTLELVPNSYYINPLEPKYGLPFSYRLNRFGTISPVAPIFGGMPSIAGLHTLSGGPVSGKSLQAGALAQITMRAGDWNFLPIVNETRVLRFGGVFINRLQLRAQRYWGDSVYVRCEEVLRDFGLSWSSASILLQDFAQAVIKMKGMAALQAKSGPKVFADAAAMIESSRSTANALLLDSEDSFERSRTPLEGLPDMLDKFARRLAAAADMPVTRLFGESPAGLNATGKVDQDWWYDKVESKQVNDLRPQLNRLYALLFKAKKGPTKGKEPGRGNWSIHFNPLRPLDPQAEADRRLKIAQADHIYVTDMAVVPEEVAVTRFGGDEYNGEKLELLESDPEKRALMAQEQAEPETGLDPAAQPNPAEPGNPERTAPGPVVKKDAAPRVVFVRHGSTNYNSSGAGERLRGWKDVPLNAAGRAETKRIAEALSKEPIEKIYSSDMQRALTTARAAQRANAGYPSLEITRKLRPWNVGQWAGQALEKHLSEMLRLQCVDQDEAPPGGESFNQFLRRFLPFVQKLMREAENTDLPLTVVFSHTRNLRAVDGWIKAGQDGIRVDPAVLRQKEHVGTGEGLELSLVGGAWRQKEMKGQ